MPLIAKNIVVKEGKQQKVSPQTVPEKKVNNIPSEGTVLIVNGKERKIGKKSQYLLDMLTLED